MSQEPRLFNEGYGFGSRGTPRDFTQEQLDCAKHAIKSAVLMNLESRAQVTCLFLVIVLQRDITTIIEECNRQPQL
uniref:Uncharacterized protein n=1 Tax=Zea mays TaxID=4577 RepID=A0A804QHV3_MAIZE